MSCCLILDFYKANDTLIVYLYKDHSQSKTTTDWLQPHNLHALIVRLIYSVIYIVLYAFFRLYLSTAVSFTAQQCTV